MFMPRSKTRARTRPLHLLALVIMVASAACRLPAPSGTDIQIEEPSPDSVELVVFLIGDAGEATPGLSPVVARLQREVETWSAQMARDSTVGVIFLGDNVYPAGVRDPGDPAYVLDTLRLRSQLEVVSGPSARKYHTHGYFLAGNHDWGNMIGGAGLRRLTNQQDRLDDAREHGIPVRLLPTAGEPGPAIVDFGGTLRVLFLDTHWWLQARSDANKRQLFNRIEQALATADGRHVIIAAHHPFVSGGAHGGPMAIWEGLGILWLLRQTGSLVQDLNSVVYRELLIGLKAVFARVGKPLLFVGGHDHSLQVLEQDEPDEPKWTLVSGAGSKVTEVMNVGGMKYANNVAGFMRVTFLRDGGVLLHVLATPERYVTCSTQVNGGVESCMQEGVDAFETVLALRLH